MIKTLKLIEATPNVIALLKSTMIDWKTELVSEDINLGELNINRVIYQRDSLSPLLFIISLIPLTPDLRQKGQSFQKGKSKLDHLLFTDDLKLYGSKIYIFVSFQNFWFLSKIFGFLLNCFFGFPPKFWFPFKIIAFLPKFLFWFPSERINRS